MAHTTTQSPPVPNAGLGHQKQYVFVDEYNRHKRLKVMRACDGCRKRKIRCDGALQNGPWPCGACIRLKLKCVPPTLDQDDDPATPDSATSQHSFTFQATSFPTSNPSGGKPIGISPRSQPTHDWSTSAAPAVSTPLSTSAPPSHPDFDLNPYAQQNFTPQLSARLDAGYPEDEYFAPTSNPVQFQQPGIQTATLLRTQTATSGSSSGDPQEIDATVRELSDRMGDFKIAITSEAPYITNHRRPAADTPAVDDQDVVLPPSVYTDSTVRIPPEMMPSEERALDYFGYYFDHIHPYAPVLNRAEFYDQWRNARSTISPLVLEAIFACVACYLEEAIETRKWLALAAKHEESYKDVPRLSTIQALIVLLKARESFPRRGYYYRSWMTVKYMVTMGIDLSLHEHYDHHRTANTCTLSKSDCMVRTRVWQNLHVLETMVGAPQGRTDFSVESDSVELSLPFPSGDVDAFEHQMSRRSTFIAQAVRNIKLSYQLCIALRRYKKDWALDPAFVRHNEDLPNWLNELPADMQIHYPDDGSPPWLGGDHWVASLHAYHHLMVIMHHRPQLQTMLEKGDEGFRKHMDICLVSAVQMCRIQEALFRDFGLHGLQFMTRGIGFTIYCVLTCMMLHLAAITAPDPVVNIQARTFFTRHMRVLEHCLPSASPEMLVQINALREAFSADTSKPFELKANLGLKSPSPMVPTPPETHSELPSTQTMTAPGGWPPVPDPAAVKTMTPVSDFGPSIDNISPQDLPGQPPIPYPNTSYSVSAHTTYATHDMQNVTSAPHPGYALKPSISNDGQPHVWDPSGIFNQWNHAFGGAAAVTQAAIPDQHNMQPTSAPVVPLQSSPTNAQQFQTPQPLPVVDQSAATVTPVMWQDAFTNAFVSGHGQKRYRQASVEQTAFDNQYKRRA